MKFKGILLLLSFLLVALLCVSSVAAIDDTDINDNNLSADSSADNSLGVYSDDSALADPTIHYVDEVGEVHTEMNDHTIQNAVNDANAGDTIVIKGKFYYHCHIIIDKPLTIKSDVGTILDPCSSIATSGYSGIFYVTSKGSGTVIEGFKFVDDDPKLRDNSYAVFVKGASDVTVRNSAFALEEMGDAIRFENSKNALIESVNISKCDNAIKFKNSQNITINNVNVEKSNIGINLIDSTQARVSNSTISGNKLAGIAFSGSGSDLTVIYNNITKNFNGINVTSPKYVYVLSNYISFNTRNGLYIDNPITLIEIKGNFFDRNDYWEIFNDFHVRDSAFDTRGNKLEVINNNYMINVGAGTEDIDRPVWTQMYEYKPGMYPSYNYDPVKDTYTFAGTSGDYYGHQDKMFLAYVFEINEYMLCPNTYYAPKQIWAQSGNYELEISDITQVKKGTYQVSIVDEKGNVATDLSSVPVTFYLNKADKSASPQEGDVYKTVMMRNGTATVTFNSTDFKEGGNVLTAVFPTPGTMIDSKVSKTLAISDSDIPGDVSNTTILVSNFTTFPYSNEYLSATLTDDNGNVLSGETLSFAVKDKVYNITTDGNGQANLTIGLAREGAYEFNISFAGNGDYYSSWAQAYVFVKYSSKTTALTAPTVSLPPKSGKSFTVSLKTTDGKPLANQPVYIKINGKTYTETTDSNGEASLIIRLAAEKTYPVIVTYKGNNAYKGCSATGKVIIVNSVKVATEISAPTVSLPPRAGQDFTVSLKTVDGKPLAGETVYIKINGKTYSDTTDDDGNASLQINLASEKTFPVSVTYNGNSLYAASSATGIVKVAKIATEISAPTVSLPPRAGQDFTVVLKTVDGKPLVGETVYIKINGKTYSDTTDNNGEASLQINLASKRTFPVIVTYKGTGIYKQANATGKVIISMIETDLECYDRTFSINSPDTHQITLKDASGNGLSNQIIKYSLNGENHSATTDSAGKINVDIPKDVGVYELTAKYDGDDRYKPAGKTTTVTIVDETGIIYVDSDLPNDEIQDILDNAPEGSDVEFLGDYYFNILLTVNNGLNIYSKDKTILNAKAENPVFDVKADDVSISGFSLQANSGDAVDINNAQNVSIYNNTIGNHLDEDKIDSYVNGTLNLPGYGISIANSSNVNVNQNCIESFESGIFAEYSSDIAIDNNTLRENNYGIKYGFGVANTQITNNEICNGIGLYIMTVPEGPTGYGIFLNNSAVNVTISNNHIANNHMGISLDAKDSTGIVITQNTITDNVLEGIRFNAGYDVAKNAVKALVTDNAIYRNARGPSMMILGELSANPEGIYGGGLYNDSQKLQLDANWYGTNKIVTWDNDSGVVGYGTMCPRINTTEIKFNNVTSDGKGNYSLVFYKNGEIASNLPEFDLFATLNRGTDKAVEVNFVSKNGVSTFSFDESDYDGAKNTIELSIGSLLNSTSRVFKVIYSFEV